jgi:hypothetical protein
MSNCTLLKGAELISAGISGFGQYHTDKNGYRYNDVSMFDILNLVDHPQNVDKAEAQWLIPSTLHSRSHKEQREKGRFHLLWADVDENPPTLGKLLAIVVGFLGQFNVEIYTSRSATEDCQKSRILIPLEKPISGDDWVICQQIFNDLLSGVGVTPDRSNEGAGQLCYLPNKGEFYDKRSIRRARLFDPKKVWGKRIQAEIEASNAAQAATEARIAESKAKREQRLAQGFDSLIDAFSAAYVVEDVLLQAGYDQRGSTFRHPASESGSYSASVKGGRVHSLSTSDPLYTGGGGGGAHDAFSAFAVLFHAGSQDEALKDAGDNWIKIGGESWNTVKRREYAKDQELTIDGGADEDLDVYPMICSADVDLHVKPPSFIIRDWLEEDAHGIMFAQSQAFKSFLALDMAHCVATGREFCGHPVKQGSVVFVIGEGRGGFMRRLKACVVKHGHTDSIHLVEAQPNITDPKDLKRLRATITAVNPVLMVIDTFSSLALGVNENDNSEVAKVLGLVRDMARSVGASSLLVHHSGKDTDRGSRGASAFKNNVDFEYGVTRKENELQAVLSCHKMKEAPTPTALRLDLDEVDTGLKDDDGKAVHSLTVVGYAGLRSSPVKEPTKNDRIAGSILKALDTLCGEAKAPTFTNKKGDSLMAFTRSEIKQRMVQLGDLHYQDGKEKPSAADARSINRAIDALKQSGDLYEESNYLWNGMGVLSQLATDVG